MFKPRSIVTLVTFVTIVVLFAGLGSFALISRDRADPTLANASPVPAVAPTLAKAHEPRALTRDAAARPAAAPLEPLTPASELPQPRRSAARDLGNHLVVPPLGFERWSELQEKLLRSDSEESEFHRLSLSPDAINASLGLLMNTAIADISIEGLAKREFAIEQLRTALGFAADQDHGIADRMEDFVRSCPQRSALLPPGLRGDAKADCAAIYEALLTYDDVAAERLRSSADANSDQSLKRIMAVGRNLHATRLPL